MCLYLLLLCLPDHKLRSHKDHGCHEQALQCRVLHPVKYAQLSAKLSQQHKYSACDFTLMSGNPNQPYTRTHLHTQNQLRRNNLTPALTLCVVKHWKWDWLVLFPMPHQYNWITHDSLFIHLFLCTQSHLFSPNTHSFKSIILVIIVHFMWICPIFHAWSALDCTLLLPNSFVFLSCGPTYHSCEGEEKTEHARLVLPQCPAQSVFCLWLLIDKSGALDVRPQRWWAIKENTKRDVRCSWGQPRHNSFWAKTLKENIYCIDSKSASSEAKTRMPDFFFYIKLHTSVYRYIYIYATRLLPSFYFSASGGAASIEVCLHSLNRIVCCIINSPNSQSEIFQRLSIQGCNFIIRK